MVAEFRTDPHGWPVSTGSIVEASNGDDRVRVFLNAPGGGPRVRVGVATGYEWDADEFTDPSELRELAAELLQAADILEAVQVGSYRPPSRTRRFR